MTEDSSTPISGERGASIDDDTIRDDERIRGSGMVADHDQHPLFLPLVFVGGFIFGVGLALSQMARPEIVLEFLQFDDFGLLFVMGGASVVVGLTFWGLTLSGRRAPLTGEQFGRRLKEMDSDVLLGGGIFGVGWGISGICPGAAYASLGIGNIVMVYGIGGMFIGAYLQGYLRDVRESARSPAAAD